MATYKISDLHNLICEIANDGYEYVDISNIPSDDNNPESLSFSAVEDFDSFIDYDVVESCNISEDFLEKTTRSVLADEYCLELNFTYKEIATIKHAVDNALEYFKECLADSTQPRDIVKEIKTASIECRNLQAKLAGFLKHIT